MRFNAFVMIAAASLLAGCGEGNRDGGKGTGSSPGAGGPKPPAEAAPSPDGEAGDGETPAQAGASNAPEQAPDPKTDANADKSRQGDASSEGEAADTGWSAMPFAEAIARIDRLERAARFAEALRLCRALRDRYESSEQRDRLAEWVVKLQRFTRQAPSLRYALEKIGPANPWEARQFARNQLLEAGEVGRLLLAKAVREGSADQAHVAAELLRRQGAWQAIPSLLGRVAEAPDGEATDAALDAVQALLDKAPKPERAAFAERFAEMFGRLQGDDRFSRRRIAELFVELPPRWWDGEFARLNEYLGVPEASVYLEAYLRVAAESDDQALREWGLRELLVLGREPPALVGWWAFDSFTDDQSPDLSGRDRPASIEGPNIVRGKHGHALRFDGEDDFARVPDAPELSGGVGAARTVSVVFQTDDPDRFGPLVEKQWDGQKGDWGVAVSGGKLAYYSEGSGNDYHANGGSVEGGRWHHAVKTIRQTEDTFELALFLDGQKVVSREEASGKISAETDGDVFIGARKYNNHQDQGHARAVIDDVRIYDRWLSAEEVEAMRIEAYLQPRLGGHGPEAAEALVSRLQDIPPEVRARILLAALGEVWAGASKTDREAHREALRRFRELADARRADGALPDAWRQTLRRLPDWLNAGDRLPEDEAEG